MATSMMSVTTPIASRTAVASLQCGQPKPRMQAYVSDTKSSSRPSLARGARRAQVGEAINERVEQSSDILRAPRVLFACSACAARLGAACARLGGLGRFHLTRTWRSSSTTPPRATTGRSCSKRAPMVRSHLCGLSAERRFAERDHAWALLIHVLLLFCCFIAAFILYKIKSIYFSASGAALVLGIVGGVFVRYGLTSKQIEVGYLTHAGLASPPPRHSLRSTKPPSSSSSSLPSCLRRGCRSIGRPSSST